MAFQRIFWLATAAALSVSVANSLHAQSTRVADMDTNIGFTSITKNAPRRPSTSLDSIDSAVGGSVSMNVSDSPPITGIGTGKNSRSGGGSARQGFKGSLPSGSSSPSLLQGKISGRVSPIFYSRRSVNRFDPVFSLSVTRQYSSEQLIQELETCFETGRRNATRYPEFRNRGFGLCRVRAVFFLRRSHCLERNYVA